jgi:hypothetical protein
MNAPVAHARLGGSSAGIFLNCTRAPSLWITAEKRKSSFYALEGTLAHLCVAKEMLQEPWRGQFHNIEGEEMQPDADMHRHVDDYCAQLKLIAQSCDAWDVEKQINLDALWTDDGLDPPEHLFGTSDFVGVSCANRTLVVSDLKYGKGVKVEVEKNPQLLYYALGSFYAVRDEFGAHIDRVQIMIYQPRMDNIRVWTIDLVDLLHWGRTVLRSAVDRICAGEGEFNPGEWCRFCAAAAQCPALQAKSDDLAVQAFQGVAAPNLTNDELGDILTRADFLQNWLVALRKEAIRRQVEGQRIPGWKMVRTRAHRQWTSTTDVLELLSTRNIGVTLWKKPELMSPAQAEKTFKAHTLDPKLLEPVVTRPPGTLSLAPESDKRPAEDASPEAAFAQIPEFTDEGDWS